MQRTERPDGRIYYNDMGDGREDYKPNHFISDRFENRGLHSHDFYELYIHYGGAKCMCVDQKMYMLQPNHLIVIPPFTLHELTPESAPVNYERAYLHVSPSVMQAAGGGHIDLVRFFAVYAGKGQNQCILPEADAQACRRLMIDMRSGMEDDSRVGRFSNHARMLFLLQIVCRNLKRAGITAAPVVVNEAMQEVLTYINGHFTQSIKLDALARQFGVSVSFLSHEFVKYTGRSVYDYVLYRRGLMAKELINSEHPLSDVAFHCGFGDYSNFLRTFRKVAGMTPTSYRKQALQRRGR